MRAVPEVRVVSLMLHMTKRRGLGYRMLCDARGQTVWSIQVP